MRFVRRIGCDVAQRAESTPCKLKRINDRYGLLFQKVRHRRCAQNRLGGFRVEQRIT